MAAPSTSMTSFDSGPFNLKLGAQEVPGGAVFSGNNLVYAYRHRGHLCFITCHPPAGQDGWTNVSPATSTWQANWSQVDTGIDMTAGLTMPAVSLPNPNTGSNDVYVCSGDSRVFRLNGSDQTVTTIPIQTAGSSTLGKTSVGATAWGTYLLVGWWNESANVLQWEAYDSSALPDPVPPGFSWQPISGGESCGTPNMFQVVGGGTLPADAFGPVASLDWYSLGGSNFYLVTSFMPNEKGSTPNILVTPMGSGPLPVATLLNEVPRFVAFPPSLLINGFPAGTTNPVLVRRDPAGRMTLSLCSGMDELMLTVSNNTDAQTAWGGSANLSNWQTVAQFGSQTAATAWVMGPSYDYAYSTSQVATRQDIFQATLYLGTQLFNNAITCDIQSFGIAELVPNAVNGQLLPVAHPPYQDSNGQTFLGAVTGLYDAPFPLPASNLASKQEQPGATLGSVVYGTTNQNGTQRSASYSKGGGFISNGQVTSGSGPAWQISFQSGNTSGSGDSEYTAMIDSQPIYTQVDSTGAQFLPYGSIISSNVYYTGDWYRVLDVNGNAMPDLPLMCTIVPIISGGLVPTSFVPYLVTPGDLNSYTREAINAKAVQLGLLQSGESDYVADVIQRNALWLSQGQNYLLWSQSENSQSVQGYMNSKDKWQETGWYLNTHIYAGWSWGFSASAGVGVSVGFSCNAETLGGWDLSESQSTTTDQSTQVQLNVDGIALPVAVQGTDIISLTVQIYYLPSNARWMQELAKCSGLNLNDTSSAPWRVFFLVTQYQSKDGSIVYP